MKATAINTRGKGLRLTLLDFARSMRKAAIAAYNRYMNWVGFYDDETPNPSMLP